MDTRGTGKSENQMKVIQAASRAQAKKSATPAVVERFNPRLVNLRILNYVARPIHGIMGQASHNVMAQMSAIVEQEKFRADPRFPLFQMMQRTKRYQAIFAGKPFQPIFP